MTEIMLCILYHIAQMLTFRFNCCVEKSYNMKGPLLVVSGAKVQVAADCIAIAASSSNRCAIFGNATINTKIMM